MIMHGILIKHCRWNEIDCFTTLLLRFEQNALAWAWHSFAFLELITL